MSPKEKAQEIVNKYILYTEKYVDGWIESDLHSAKFCALIAVDEISWILNEISHNTNIESEMYFYQEVKQEIEKL